MANLDFINKVFRPDVIREASESRSSLPMVFRLMLGLLIYPDSGQKTVFKLTPFMRGPRSIKGSFKESAFKAALARIVLSPLIAVTLAALFAINAVFSVFKGIANLFTGQWEKALQNLLDETISSIVAIPIALILVVAAPILNTAQFLVRAFSTLYSLVKPNNQEVLLEYDHFNSPFQRTLQDDWEDAPVLDKSQGVGSEAPRMVQQPGSGALGMFHHRVNPESELELGSYNDAGDNLAALRQ